MKVSQIFQQDPSPPTSLSTHVTDIHYVSTLVNEWMRLPCSLCESIDHFMYQCPLIIEYKCRQMELIQNPLTTSLSVLQVIPPIPSPDTIHITSPELESLPTPPWLWIYCLSIFPKILRIL